LLRSKGLAVFFVCFFQEKEKRKKEIQKRKRVKVEVDITYSGL